MSAEGPQSPVYATLASEAERQWQAYKRELRKISVVVMEEKLSEIYKFATENRILLRLYDLIQLIIEEDYKAVHNQEIRWDMVEPHYRRLTQMQDFLRKHFNFAGFVDYEFIENFGADSSFQKFQALITLHIIQHLYKVESVQYGEFIQHDQLFCIIDNELKCGMSNVSIIEQIASFLKTIEIDRNSDLRDEQGFEYMSLNAVNNAALKSARQLLEGLGLIDEVIERPTVTMFHHRSTKDEESTRLLGNDDAQAPAAVCCCIPS